MRTYEEIRADIIWNLDRAETMGLKPSELSFEDVTKKAVKEYAKQWIDRAAEVETRTEYMTDSEWILRLKDEIDAQ